MALCSTRGVGQYVASETHRGIWGRATVTGKGVVWLTGSHSLADAIVGSDVIATVTALADSGYKLLGGDIGQTTSQGTFGNDTARTRAGQLKTYVQGTLGATAGKVHLWGGSGGATAAINYARANPTLVASMFLVVPLVDIADFYTNYLNGGANGASGVSGVTQAEINKAYNAGVDDGGTAYLAAMPTHNPIAVSDLANLAGIPIKLAYSTDDPYIQVSKVTGFATLVNAAGGSATAYSQGAVGHTGLGVAAQDVVDFFNQHP